MMRFAEIKRELLEIKNVISGVDEENKLKKAIYNRPSVEYLKEKIKELDLMHYFKIDIKEIEDNKDAYTGTELRRYNDALQSVINKIDLIIHINSLSTNIIEENYSYIYAVKLPKYEFFDDVADFTKQLNFIFSTVMSSNRKVKLVGFDKGSEWYQVALDSFVDFKVLAVFISEVTKYVKFKVEDKLRENEIEFNDEAKKLILENMKTNQAMVKEYSVKKVLDENGINSNSNPEEFERHQKAFENMAELMIKGTRVEVDKQIATNDSSQSECKIELPKLESVQKLLEVYSASLIEHSKGEDE